MSLHVPLTPRTMTCAGSEYKALYIENIGSLQKKMVLVVEGYGTCFVQEREAVSRQGASRGRRSLRLSLGSSRGPCNLSMASTPQHTSMAVSTNLGVLVIGIMVYWGPFWGPLVLEHQGLIVCILEGSWASLHGGGGGS